MAHWKSMTDTTWLFAFDLTGQERHVQIDRVEAGELIGQGGRKTKKPSCYFKGVPKPLALNATNAKAIAAIVGSPDTDRWVGQWITIYPTTCTTPTGEQTECVRIRPKAPTPPVKP